jgi:hypothetical protein
MVSVSEDECDGDRSPVSFRGAKLCFASALLPVALAKRSFAHKKDRQTGRSVATSLIA